MSKICMYAVNVRQTHVHLGHELAEEHVNLCGRKYPQYL